MVFSFFQPGSITRGDDAQRQPMKVKNTSMKYGHVWTATRRQLDDDDAWLVEIDTLFCNIMTKSGGSGPSRYEYLWCYDFKYAYWAIWKRLEAGDYIRQSGPHLYQDSDQETPNPKP